MTDLANCWAEPYVVLVETTGVYHLRYRIGGRSVDDRRCNIGDDLIEVSLDSLADVDPWQECGWCFPGAGGGPQY